MRLELPPGLGTTKHWLSFNPGGFAPSYVIGGREDPAVLVGSLITSTKDTLLLPVYSTGNAASFMFASTDDPPPQGYFSVTVQQVADAGGAPIDPATAPNTYVQGVGADGLITAIDGRAGVGLSSALDYDIASVGDSGGGAISFVPDYPAGGDLKYFTFNAAGWYSITPELVYAVPPPA